MCISTDPEEHAEFARRYIDVGFNRLYIHSSGPDQLAFIENYGRNVIPLIKERKPSEVTARGAA
jgi:coenzyme F420-dependent glucose-6-phosphate dehydrogenase